MPPFLYIFSFGYFPGFRLSFTEEFFIKPLKMDLTEGSETSAKLNLTPGKYPKENIQDSEHGGNVKSRNATSSKANWLYRSAN
jgi:hypothetical protein